MTTPILTDTGTVDKRFAGPYHPLRLKVEHVGYEKVRNFYPSLFLSYCLDDGRASKFFAHRYRDEKALLARARKAAERGIERGVLEALRRYHEECGAPAESLRALAKLGAGAAIVLTGQQPHVGWGPLYNFYKAQAAMKYAQAIEARGVPCVAAFWNHSDDTRMGTPPGFPDRENRIVQVPLPPEEEGRPLYATGGPEALRLFVSGLAAALPGTEFTAAVVEFLRATHRGSVAESFTRTVLGVLGRFGLVVLEPRHLEGERAERFFAGHLAAPDRLSRAVEEGRRAVRAEALEDHLGRDVGLDLFEVRDGRRERVEPPGPAKGRLSAGVALRPLLQDEVLPTCAYVGGPSEVGYQAALLPAYRAFGIEPPVVFPRVTATLVEPRVARSVEKFGLGAAELFGPEDALAARVGGGAEDPAAGLAAASERYLRDLSGELRRFGEGPDLDKARERTAAKVREALDAFAARLAGSLSRREETARGRRDKLLAHLRPHGKLQERVFTPLYYQALFGPDFLPRLLGTLDPFVFSHQLITIL